METSNNNKHAYCIIAHNEPKILATLVELIDDERNDIFLLVDKKTDIGIYDGIHPNKANCIIRQIITIFSRISPKVLMQALGRLPAKEDGLSIKIQRMLGVQRKSKMQLMKGCNWCSITNELVSYLIENKDNILHNFAYMLCADEIFLQTMVWNSKFMENVYAKEEYVSCLREIKWTKGSPYI